MKIIGPIMMIILLADISACSKSKTAAISSSWQVGDTSYTGAIVKTDAKNKYITVSNGFNGLAVYFPFIPPAAGTYLVVSHGAASTLGANEIAVDANTGFADTYFSTGFDYVSAQVTISGDKVNIVLPPLWARHYNAYGPLGDSLQISGGIREY